MDARAVLSGNRAGTLSGIGVRASRQSLNVRLIRVQGGLACFLYLRPFGSYRPHCGCVRYREILGSEDETNANE